MTPEDYANLRDRIAHLKASAIGTSFRLSKAIDSALTKFNPYHGKDGRFTTAAAAHTESGKVRSWHGTAAKEKLLKEGYVVGAPGSSFGKGVAILGAGMYLADNPEIASKYGELLSVETAKVRLKRVTLDEVNKVRVSPEVSKRVDELEAAWKGNFFHMPDYRNQAIAEHFAKLGYDGLSVDFSDIAPPGAPPSGIKVLFDPQKSVVSLKEAASGGTNLAIHSSGVPKAPGSSKKKSKGAGGHQK